MIFSGHTVVEKRDGFTMYRRNYTCQRPWRRTQKLRNVWWQCDGCGAWAHKIGKIHHRRCASRPMYLPVLGMTWVKI